MNPVAKTQTVAARTEIKKAAEPAKVVAPSAKVVAPSAKVVAPSTKVGIPSASGKKAYVPPPPAGGVKVRPPAGMPSTKTFPISQGPSPNGMTFPGVVTAEPEERKAGEAATAEEEVDDGFTPE